MPEYRYELRRGEEVIATGHMSREQPRIAQHDEQLVTQEVELEQINARFVVSPRKAPYPPHVRTASKSA